MSHLRISRINPLGRKSLPHNPAQYAVGDAAYLNRMAGLILGVARAGVDMNRLNRHQRRVEDSRARKRR